jgi:hypothetical protein
MAQQQSKLPSGEELSKPMIAFLQMIESRFPSDTSTIDTGTITLPELAARVNQLIQDLNKR